MVLYPRNNTKRVKCRGIFNICTVQAAQQTSLYLLDSTNSTLGPFYTYPFGGFYSNYYMDLHTVKLAPYYYDYRYYIRYDTQYLGRDSARIY
jgi:hypothetical protein